MISPGNARTPVRYASYMRGLRKLEAADSLMIYADVAIDRLTREVGERLFTYAVPAHLQSEVFVGSQVLVPLGHQDMVAGYVVALADAATRQPEFKVRPIAEVLESEPLFDRAYVALLQWVADYYAASIAEVIAAAVPADVGPRVKRVVRLVEEMDERIDGSGIIAALKQSRTRALAVKALKQRTGLGAARFHAALSQLRQQGVITVERESSVKVAPKLVQKVIWTGADCTTKKQEAVVNTLKRGGGEMSLAALVEGAGTTRGTIKRMCDAGVLTLVQDEVIRDPLAHLNEGAVASPGGFGNGSKAAQSDRVRSPKLTPDQQRVFATLSKELSQVLEGADGSHAPAQPWLLHGVTGSGKTEIYLRLIAECLQRGRTALMLVPEISLTPQLAQRLVGRFGDQVAVWHSGLSPGERFDTWRRLRAGQAKILLGARSAVLANMPELGLIILDEEHDSSYKQSSPSPRYHAKTVALERAARSGAMVLLGSATPDAATYHECRATGRIVSLPQRVFSQPLPESIIVDMRQEYALGNRSIFSRTLQDAITQRLQRQEQVILLINRRGYASQVFCRACGFVTRCRHCSVALVFHQLQAGKDGHPEGDRSGYLMCHHCGFRMGTWQTCPACHSPFIRQLGLGTQRVQEEAQALFPEARLLRLDSDITARRGACEEVFRQFGSGAADILIGTQIVAKGLDIERVTLVGVLAADSAFNLPDYRSVERGFQLLTQVSGRAGRGQHAGAVVLQTFNVDLPALSLARKQDYESFVEQELESRRAFEYPPFSQIIRVVIQGEHEAEVEYACEQLAEELSTHLEDQFTEDEVKILGPAPCLIERLRGKFRHHLIVKNMAGEPGRMAVTRFLRQHRGTPTLSIAVDVEAVDLI